MPGDLKKKANHEFEAFDGATSRTCTRLVLDDDGYADDCGLPPEDHV